MFKQYGVLLNQEGSGFNVEQSKLYAKILKDMGYDYMLFYLETSYEIEGHPYFGHFRGKYSKEELKEINDYCDSIGLELIPSIEVLGHLDWLFQRESVYNDIRDAQSVLLVGHEKTYELIEGMIKTISECFTSRRINLGMDETYGLGEGKYKKLYGEEDKYTIFVKHLYRVCEIIKKYGYEKPTIWHDMLLNTVDELKEKYSEDKVNEILQKYPLPEEISITYWEYFYHPYERYTVPLEKLKKFNREILFVGAAWNWIGIAPDNAFSLRVTEREIPLCIEAGIQDVAFSVWGRFNSHFVILPSLMYNIEFSKGNSDIDSIRKKFKEITGCEFEDFMLFDEINQCYNDEIRNGDPLVIDMFYERHFRPDCILYADLFIDNRGSIWKMSDAEYFEKLADKIHNVKERGNFGYLFDFYEKFSRALALKVTLGLEIRDAYDKKDMNKLKELIAKCELTAEKIRDFYEAFRVLWLHEKKPHGFQALDIMLGGLIQRILGCKRRLEEFVNGEVSNIEELDEPMLEATNGSRTWIDIISPGYVNGHF